MKKHWTWESTKSRGKSTIMKKVHLSCHFLFIFDHYIGPVTREITTVGPSSEAPASEEPSLNRAKRKFKLEHDAVGATITTITTVCRKRVLTPKSEGYSVVKNQASRCPYRPWIAFWKSLRVSLSWIPARCSLLYPPPFLIRELFGRMYI